MRKLILAAAMCSAVGSYVHAAAQKKMPIDFIGEWCAPEKDGDTTTYTLPSWTEDHKCTDILSIDQWQFVFNMGGEEEIYCDPVSVRTKADTAPSGTAYFATISANCYAGTAPDRKTRRTVEFERYKGRLMLKSK
ncbi:hypothetical protein [Bradyrhizobium sp. WYCCWR 12699]|uniref:hypothetical protein n=1 Tax=Bradyrhizobium sp. WYCCWR 12699 TaxID=3064203 RepID=UPI0028A57FB4|nr:hypothetical protein [Bradyrhizobium sp. WYCCWR 12699]MDT4739243.1 hypothetical protein [Bradyrhizobium sp. WYCCWR 12699]